VKREDDAYMKAGAESELRGLLWVFFWKTRKKDASYKILRSKV